MGVCDAWERRIGGLRENSEEGVVVDEGRGMEKEKMLVISEVVGFGKCA